MIRLKDLHVRLADRGILKGVDLEAAAGETVALMGVSGSGKSTLLRAAVGLIAPEQGEAWLAGERLADVSRSRLIELRRKAGMLFQGNALFDSMTVSENIGFALREVLRLDEREIGRRVDELLSRLKLGPIGGKYPAELSGGMKKRVGIARAVAHDPAIMFYDDPTAGLDPITSEVIAELITELADDDRRAVIVATNHPPLIVMAASRVVLLKDGGIVELGPPARVFKGGRIDAANFLE